MCIGSLLKIILSVVDIPLSLIRPSSAIAFGCCLSCIRMTMSGFVQRTLGELPEFELCRSLSAV